VASKSSMLLLICIIPDSVNLILANMLIHHDTFAAGIQVHLCTPDSCSNPWLLIAKKTYKYCK
jgi:hypothetical protein